MAKEITPRAVMVYEMGQQILLDLKAMSRAERAVTVTWLAAAVCCEHPDYDQAVAVLLDALFKAPRADIAAKIKELGL